jgi:hypothetical protein
MRKIEVTLTQVYRINGRLVVANSIEGAINTWREWMSPNTPEIQNIERMRNDSYQAVGDDALVCVEGLFGTIENQFVEDIARLNEEKEKLTYELEKREAYCADLEKRIQELSACAGK